MSSLDEGLPAAATGVGSMPGTSVAEAMAVIAGELPDLPHLPELPARGAGADMIGRTGALLTGVTGDLGLETIPTGWRIAGGRSRDMRRATSWMGEDLDRAEEVLGGTGGWFKIQVCGPWTFAAAVESPRGGPVIKDAGLVREISEAMGEALPDHVSDVRRRLGDRRIVVQIDEPGLPAVLDGRVPTASGLGRLAAVPQAAAAAALEQILGAVAGPSVLHCCGPFPFEVARSAGFAGVSWDLTQAGPDPADEVAETFESGVRLLMGAVAASGEGTADSAWAGVSELWRRTGLGHDSLAEVAFTPACGLAGTPPARTAGILRRCEELRRRAASDRR